jgi:hypothetical protein
MRSAVKTSYPLISAEIAKYLALHPDQSKQTFAETLGVNINTFYFKLRGERQFSLSEAAAVADILDLSLDHLAGRKGYTIISSPLTPTKGGTK